MKRLLYLLTSLIFVAGFLQITNGGHNNQGGQAAVLNPLLQGINTLPYPMNPFLTPDWIGEANYGGDSYGAAVSTAGDVNGDGYADIILGAPYYMNGEIMEGRVYAYYGSATGLSTTPDWTFESNLAKCQLGWKVASAGDVNNDGFDDVLASSEYCTTGDPDTHREGRVYLFLGSADGLPSNYNWMKNGGTSDESFGWSIASAGDVNNDGFDDVIIGAPWADYPEGNEGRAYVFYGSASGFADTANWVTESDIAWTGYGTWVDSAGDVNGDGYADVIVGHPGWSSPDEAEGRAYVYLGSVSGLSLTASWTFENNHAYSELGISVAGVGDINGDGYDDVMVGGGKYPNPLPYEGIAYLFLGSAAGPLSTPAWSQEGNQKWAQFGWSIAPAGDVNDDGYDDVIIGSPWYTDTLRGEGASFLFFGSPNVNPFTTEYHIGAKQTDAKWGWSVNTAGDVNGDGRDDIIVGARDYDGGENNEGRAVVFYGMPDFIAQILLPITLR
ncbi:MAG: hypothetical protein C3F13_09085 [Anaerolineales bacterium]|nr:hypothetical protein [Anaerolineae bacterium]PWB53554.1 MAG: hypothetical protein C3F13_09085 [Anaerolineales bacterium]